MWGFMMTWPVRKTYIYCASQWHFGCRSESQGAGADGACGACRTDEKKTGKYSRGMRQRLDWRTCLSKSGNYNPGWTYLGIDPAGVQEFIELIRQLSRKEDWPSCSLPTTWTRCRKFATAWDCSTVGSWSPWLICLIWRTSIRNCLIFITIIWRKEGERHE